MALFGLRFVIAISLFFPPAKGRREFFCSANNCPRPLDPPEADFRTLVQNIDGFRLLQQPSHLVSANLARLDYGVEIDPIAEPFPFDHCKPATKNSFDFAHCCANLSILVLVAQLATSSS